MIVRLAGRSLSTAYFAVLTIDNYKTEDPSTECWTFSPELALNYQGKVMKNLTLLDFFCWALSLSIEGVNHLGNDNLPRCGIFLSNILAQYNMP